MAEDKLATSPLLETKQSHRKRQKPGRVCTACRQAKAKCDAPEKFPNNCSRCDETSQNCRIDPQFKRTRRVPKHAVSITSGVVNNDVAPSGPLPPNKLAETKDPSVSNLALCDALLDKFTIGGITLNTRQVTQLFETFFDRHHQYCPILLERRQPVVTYINDRFLFWAIVSVASQALFYDPMLEDIIFKTDFMGIMDGVKRMTGDLGIWPSRDVSTVQGLILLAHWCFPSFRNKDDRALHYINLAIELGMQMGLHRPFHSFEYTSRLSLQATATSVAGRERTMAWIACYCTVQFMSAEWGLPVQIREDWVITKASAAANLVERPDWLADIPQELLQCLCIARQLGKGSNLLGNSPDTPTGQADLVAGPIVWSALQDELDAVDLSNGQLDGHLTALSLWTRFRHCCFGLQMNCSGAQRAAIVAQLYKYGLQIIDLFDKNEDGLHNWPNHVLQIIKLTAIILLRLMSSVDGSELEVGPLLQTVSVAYRLLLKLVMFPNDRYHRYSKMLAFTAKSALDRRSTGQLYGTSQAGGFGEVKTRIGTGNYNHDCIATAKRVRGAHSAEYSNESSDISNKTIPGFWLPETSIPHPAHAPLPDEFVFDMDDFDGFDNLLSEWNATNVTM